MRKLILRNQQSPGDIVMLTAAVATDMRTLCPAVLASRALLQGNRIKISASVILKSRRCDEPEKSSGVASLTEKAELFSDFDAIALRAAPFPLARPCLRRV